MLKKINSNKFLLYSSILGQVATIVFTPFITRLESKTQIGLYSVFFAAVGIYTLVGAFRIELGFVENATSPNEDKRDLGSTSSMLSLGTSLIFSLVVQGVYQDLALSILTFFGCFLTINSIICTYWTISEKDISNLVLFRFSKPIFIILFQLIFISLDVDKGLIIGYDLGILASIVFFRKKTFQFRILDKKTFVSKLKQNINFIKYTTPSDFMNTLGTQLPIFIFERMFGLEYSATYLYTQRIVISPFAIITESLSKTLLQLYSLKDDINLMISQILSVQIKFYIAAFGGILLFDELIVSILFGDGWDEMGFLFKGSFFWVLSVFISVPILSLLSITKNQRKDLSFQVTLFVFRLSALLLGYFLDSFNSIFLIFCFASAIPYLIYFRKTLKILSINIDTKEWLSVENILSVIVLLFMVFYLQPRIDTLLNYILSAIFVGLQFFSTYRKFRKLNMDL